MQKKSKKRMSWTTVVILFLLLAGIGYLLSQREKETVDVPAYNGQAYIEINEGKPEFSEREISSRSFESYSPLDYLSRCGPAFACLGQELMPTEGRGSIGGIKPSGWRQAKYPGIIPEDPPYLYNRCHLIAYQLAGENANERNLITGTRYMNVSGMQPWENKVAGYIRRTGNHVIYRVTPLFVGNELVCRGVYMEAWSVEDRGEGICFHIFVYNVQPGIEIDYRTGRSALGDSESYNYEGG